MLLDVLDQGVDHLVDGHNIGELAFIVGSGLVDANEQLNELLI